MPDITSDVNTLPLAPAQPMSHVPESTDDHHGPTTRSAKRKLDQRSLVLIQLRRKRVCHSIDGCVDAGERLRLGLRGGSNHRSRVVADSDDEYEESGKNAQAGSPETPPREPAAKADESLDESESTSSSQKPIEETDGTGSENDSSGPTSSSHKTGDDTGSKEDSSEPISSSRKTVSGTDSNSDETNESAGSSEEVANGSNTTSDTTSSVSETTANEESNDEKPSKKVARIETRLTERQPRHISGLLNNSNQCFSNSVIQLVDAAIDGHDIDVVLGEVESTSPFVDPKLSEDDSFMVPNTRSARKTAKKPLSKMDKVRAAVHDRIKKVRKSGKLQALSPRKHLRALLHRVRQIKGKGQSELVTPYVFQQILAYGDENESRQHLDGRDQEDCYEYLQAVLAGIKDDSGNNSEEDESGKPAIIDSLFDFKSETASICSNESCNRKGAIEKATSNTHTIQAPKSKANLEDLLEQSNVSELDIPCPKCGEETLERVTGFKDMADNFVLHINRVGEDQITKVKTAIELPMQEIELCGKKFMLNAVIRHRGDSVSAGHYTIFRKRSRDWITDGHTNSSWYHIDDHEILPVKAVNVKDHGRNGQSTILLFKAV